MPTDKVHVLHTARPVNADAVEKLEEALAEAKAGEIVAVAIASVTFNGAARTAYSTSENAVTQLGAVQYLCVRLATSLIG